MVRQQESDALGETEAHVDATKIERHPSHYLQMCRRLRKFFCDLVKIIAHRRTFHGITEVVKLTTTVSCY